MISLDKRTGATAAETTKQKPDNHQPNNPTATTAKATEIGVHHMDSPPSHMITLTLPKMGHFGLI
jgi:hypothetical protein